MAEELTPTQKESRRWADAVLADPDLRARFDVLVQEAEKRSPVRDDFKWLTARSTKSTQIRFLDGPADR